MGPREVLETFVTLARWGNVLSKLGRKYDMSRAKQLFAEDVLEEAALQVHCRRWDTTLVDGGRGAGSHAGRFHQQQSEVAFVRACTTCSALQVASSVSTMGIVGSLIYSRSLNRL